MSKAFNCVLDSCASGIAKLLDYHFLYFSMINWSIAPASPLLRMLEKHPQV
jgi:hypothetical protein